MCVFCIPVSVPGRACHAAPLTPSIAVISLRACRVAERTFLVPDAQLKPENPLSFFLATYPKKHLLTPSIATLPKRPEITPLFATHPIPPRRASRLQFTANADEWTHLPDYA